MKKNLLFIALLFSTLSFSQIITFPDAAFKAKLLTYGTEIDTNGDGEIQVSEAENYTGTININGQPNNPGNITDLTGLEYFKNITQFFALYNQLQVVDLSNNSKLTTVNISSNAVTSINLSNCNYLQTLYCNYNAIASINLTDCISLNTFECNNNQLTELNFSNNPLLQTVFCRTNQLTSINVTQCPELIMLIAGFNQLQTIDLSQNLLLENLYLNSNQFTGLNLLTNSLLTTLDCSDNLITELNTTPNPALYQLFCFNNQISSLTLSNPELVLLSCGYNPYLTNIYLGEVPSLSHLNCIGIPITSLNLSLCPAINLLVCNLCENLEYINIKNGNNQNINTSYVSLDGLSSLETVCVDDANSTFAAFITMETGELTNITDTCTLTAKTFTQENYIVYPNPAKNSVFIKGDDILRVRVNNNIGHEIMVTENTTVLNCSEWPSGLYHIIIETSNGTLHTNKVIKI